MTVSLSLFEFFDVVDTLGLDEIHAGLDLFGQPPYPQLERVGKRVASALSRRAVATPRIESASGWMAYSGPCEP